MTTAIAEYSQTEGALADLASRYKGVVFNVATPAGMAEARKGRAELRTLRTGLEAMRKEIKAPALERTRLIDAEARRITAALVELEDPIDQAIRSEETRKERERAERERLEAERIAGIQQAIAGLNAIVPSMSGKGPQAIAERIEALNAYDVSEWAQEFLDTATNAKASALAALQQLHAGAVAQEAEQVRIKADLEELAKLREASMKAEAERVATETEARRRIEEAERASRAKIEDAERHARLEREAADTEARKAREAADAALKAATARVDAERRETEEAARKVREAEEAKARETQRQANELLDAAAMLATFVKRFGHRQEFAPLVAWITKYLNSQRKAA